MREGKIDQFLSKSIHEYFRKKYPEVLESQKKKIQSGDEVQLVPRFSDPYPCVHNKLYQKLTQSHN